MGEIDLATEYRRLAPELAQYAATLVGSADAADIVADAVAATISRGSIDRIDDLRRYWFRAVTNTSRSWHRSRKRRVARESKTFALDSRLNHGPTHPIESMPLLAALSTQQRAVVYLTYWEDLTPESVADLMGVSEGSVRRQLARARARMREVIGNE